MNHTQLLAVLLTILLAQYTLAWLNAYRLGKLLPLDTPDAVQNFWNTLQRRKGMLGGLGIVLIALGLIFISDTLAKNPDLQLKSWRASGLMAVTFVLALVLVGLLPGLPLDRKIRQATWSPLRHAVYVLGFRLFWFWPLFSLLFAAEASRQIAIVNYHDTYWPILNVLSMLLVFWYVASMCSMLGRRLIGLRPLVCHPLNTQVTVLCAAAGVQPPRVYLLPERGGKIPLLAVMGRSLIVSEYLIREIPPEQLRAGIAHEVGHLAAGDVRRRMRYLMLLTLAGMLLVSLWPRELYGQMLHDAPLLILLIPLLPLLFLPRLLLRGYREQEFQADRLGAQLIGDPLLMAAALERIHTLAYLPASFPKEKRMTHPSLVHRLEALRLEKQTEPIFSEVIKS